MILLVTLVLAAARYLLPRPFAWAAQSPETLFIWSLCWCFFIVAAAHTLHLSAESGAFLAGLSLAQLPYNRDLRRRVHPLMNFFIAVFFVSLGIQMDLSALAHQGIVALVLIAFVVAGKYLILLWALLRVGFSARTSHLAGVTLSQISEFSFIFVAVLARSGWVDRSEDPRELGGGLEGRAHLRVLPRPRDLLPALLRPHGDRRLPLLPGLVPGRPA